MLTVVTPVLADSASTTRQEILATLNIRDQAYAHGNLIAYLQTYSPSWTVVDVSGIAANYKKLAAGAAQMFATDPADTKNGLRSQLRSLTITNHGVEAIIVSRLVYPRKHTKVGTVYVYRTITSDDVWAKNNHTWQEQSGHYLQDQVTYSVKPLAE